MDKPLPLYKQLADTLRDKIYEGYYAFGDMLPAEKAMAAEYGISHLTVRKALDLLKDEGLLIRIQGKGTFVRSPQMSADMQSLGSFSNIMRNRHAHITSKVLYSGVRKANFKYSRIFGIAKDCDVFESVKLKSSNDIPLAVEYTAIPLLYVPDIAEYDYSVYSLYDVYAKHDIHISQEDQRLEIVKIYNPIAALLEKEDGDDIFLLTSSAYDASGKIIEFTRLYDNDDRIIFYASSTGEKNGIDIYDAEY